MRNVNGIGISGTGEGESVRIVNNIGVTGTGEGE